MTENEIKLFRRFLKENGIYSSFVRNYDCSFSGIIRDMFINSIRSVSLNEYLSLIDPHFVISSAFNWCVADIGMFEYWHYYNKEWLECYDKSISKNV